MITFKNQPKLMGSEVDKKRDALRVSLVSHIEQFLITDDLFIGKNVTIEFSHEGISSLVCFVETEAKKYVLKIPLTNTVPEGSETLFLKTWEAAGVKVPHVFKEGIIDNRPYVLMEFVDAPSLGEKYGSDPERMEEVYVDAGKTLKKMHSPEASGFGLVVGGKGEFATFSEWLNASDMKKREEYIELHNLLQEEHGSYATAKEMLIAYIGTNRTSSYCHFDYSEKHLFATEPPTVFDPNPFFNHGYIDLGKTLVNYIARTAKYPEGLVTGYGKVDLKILHAAIFVNIVYKLPYQHQKARTEVIQNFHTYLSLNRNLFS